MSQTITASAPGKLMLFGEHAVVYGYPCLVTAVDLRVTVTVEESASDQVTIYPSTADAPYEIRVGALKKAESFPRESAFVLAAAQHIYNRFDLAAGLNIITAGPARSFGLGSSSAVTAAAVGALDGLFGLSLGPREMFDMAYQAVRDVQQKKASGFDVAAAIYGGTLYFVTGGETITPLDIGDPPIIIGYSGQKVSTVDLVGMVGERYERYPETLSGIFELMAGITDRAKDHLLAGDWDRLGELADINQGLLDSLGVNTLDLSRLIDAARAAGALGAKLSGAGGGDCMFAIVEGDSRSAVERAIMDAGGEIVALALNAPGVRLE